MNGTDGTDGTDGADGADGSNGTDGVDGKTTLIQTFINITWRVASMVALASCRHR